MEDNNQNNNSTYHYGRGESPYSRENINGGPTYYNYQENVNTDTETVSGTVEPDTNNTYSHKKEKKEKKSGKGKKIALFISSAAAFGLIAGCVMVGVNVAGNKIFGDKDKKASTEIATVAPTTKEPGSASEDDVADVVESVMPSIVSVTNTSVQTVRSWFQSYEREVKGAGSGIIIGQTDDEILIATNNHVIDGAKEITITFCDETSVAADIKGVDSISDLAVIAVKTKDMEKDTLGKIKVAALGSSDDLRVGEAAIAIGNSLGYGQSVTVGYISALNRDVETDSNTTIKMLQTDAAINPGNSGGALLNANGEVIGINSAKYVDSTVEGMGYAIPISDAIPVINDLMNQEVIAEDEQGYLGIQGNDITDEYAQGFSMPKGVYVVKILDDSPASDCGLKAGDIITKFADREVSSMENLQSILSNKKAGETIKMVIQRNNEKGEYEEVELKVTLGAKKDMPQANTKEDKEDETEIDSSNDKTPDEDMIEEFESFFGR
ncbi:MAG: S1C family serine protease [Lachnospiraceae bacterium]